MTFYINTKTNQWPLYEYDIRTDINNWSDSFVVPDGYAQVIETPSPNYNFETEYLKYTQPIQSSGNFYMQWMVVKYTAEELKKLNEIKNPPKEIIKEPIDTNANSTSVEAQGTEPEFNVAQF